MTQRDASLATRTGSRARTRANERPVRCEAIKSETGRPCRRNAGAGTDHPGEGPCANHDDGTWTSERVAFAENEQAQDAFIEAVRTQKYVGIRTLLAGTGYVKRDVDRLLDEDKDFESAYHEARGWDHETIRMEIRKRASEGSDRLLEFEGKMRLPEAAVLRQTKLEGQVDVRGVPYLDTGKLDADELEQLARLLRKAAPGQDELPRDGRPALELVSDTGT